MEEIARDVATVPMAMVNAYIVGTAQAWILVDSGTAGSEEKIKKAAEERFGPGTKPRAIVLTHGHFDHAGSADVLANEWGVPVFTHKLEFPYLKGDASYPPADPTVPGVFALLSRFFPARTSNVGDRLEEIGNNLSTLGFGEWQAVHTPGHTAGHLVFFRQSDGVLLAGDALTTMNQDSLIGLLSKRKELCGPPTPMTPDWEQARRSVQEMARLRPKVIAAGHGTPMTGVTDELQRLSDNFPVPEHGRYVNDPARTDETGVTYLPPPAFDALPKVATGVAAAVVMAGAGAAVLAFKKNRQ